MQDVTKDRAKYIGGSDIPIIMGLSSFKTRYELLQDKAEIREENFLGNEYTEYGNIMEGKIRDYVSGILNCDFQEYKTIKEDLRYHADGYDVLKKVVLEVKTTSEIHDDKWAYKRYIVQLALGMDINQKANGVLAVYARPEDFGEEFDSTNLHVYSFSYIEIESLLKNEIYPAIDLFRADLERIKENPFLTEEDLTPNEIVKIADMALELENRLIQFKEIEKESKNVKQRLKEAMEKYGIKTWLMNNGTKITLVPDGVDTVTKAFDEKTFAKEHEDVYRSYMVDKVKKGRSGYVRITPPKEV